MNWWESQAASVIVDGVKRLQEEAEKERQKRYELHGRYFLGTDTKQDLVRHIAEGADAWYERQQRYTDCGLTRRIASAFISSLYGHDVKRELRDANDAQVEVFEDVLADSRIGTKQRMIGQDQVVAGDGFSLVAYSDDLGQLLVHSVDPGNVFVETHPDDPMRERVVVERRNVDPNDPSKFVFWIWTEGEYLLVDDVGRTLEQGDNPYGVIPYTHWRGLPLSESYWGLSPITGVVQLHRYCNNLRSQADHIVLYQAHSLLAVRGLQTGDKLELSENNVLVLGPDGQASYLAPGADLAAIENAYQRSRKEAFEVAGIPMSLVEGGQAPSGYALVVEYRSMAEVVEDLAVEAKEAEEDMIWMMCQVGRAHGLNLPDDPVVSVDLGVEVTPADREGDRQRDLLDVQAGMMTKRDYIQRHRPDIPDEMIDDYLEQLDAERSKATVDSFGGGRGDLLGSFNPRDGVA